MRSSLVLGSLVVWSSLAVAEPDHENLRVAIACAEGLATPASGLVVRVDGQPLAPAATNGHDVVMYQPHGLITHSWVLDDFGYVAAPGVHRVEIGARSCATTAFEVTLDPDLTELASGRLVLTDTTLAGPTGAPNGGGFVFGPWLGHARMAAPASPNPLQTVTPDPVGGAQGGFFSTTFERRHLAAAADFMFGAAATTGTVAGQGVFGAVAPQSYAGTTYDTAIQFRVGARAAKNWFAIAAGGGVAIEMAVTRTSLNGNALSGLEPPNGVDAEFYVPVWAALTVKPVCDIGLQLLAQYDVRPAAMSSSGPAIGVGFVIQPSDSCRQAPGIQLHSS
jgi:hypothetical protein